MNDVLKNETNNIIQFFGVFLYKGDQSIKQNKNTQFSQYIQQNLKSFNEFFDVQIKH